MLHRAACIVMALPAQKRSTAGSSNPLHETGASTVEQELVQQLQQQPLLQSNEVPAEPPADAPGVTKLQITLAGNIT
jgi:hypothetical protein